MRDCTTFHRRLLPAIVLLAALCATGASQQPPATGAAQPKPAAPGPRPRVSRRVTAPSADAQIRPLLDRYFAAWSTRNADRPASLYASDPGLVFYDVTGTPQVGWDAYKKSRADFFAQFSSVQLARGDDLQIHSSGAATWTTVSFRGVAVSSAWGSVRWDGRHTAVWERRGTDWVIVHEHLSVPLADTAALLDRFRPAVSEQDTRAAISALLDRYRQAWNRGDAAGLAALWHETGDIVTLGTGVATRGRTAVATMWTDTIARRSAGFSTTLDVTVGEIRTLGREVGLADGTFDYWRGALRAGSPAAQERFTSVLTRKEGRWAIESLRVAIVPQKAAPAAKPKGGLP